MIAAPADRVTSLALPALIRPTVMVSPGVARVMSLVSSSVLDVSTSVAVMAPPAVTVMEPSAVSRSERVMASNSLIAISPVEVECATRLETCVSRSMRCVAVAVSWSAMTSVAESPGRRSIRPVPWLVGFSAR